MYKMLQINAFYVILKEKEVNQMKIILSRKGMDSTFGNLSNLVFTHDNESEYIILPIPSLLDKATYDDLRITQYRSFLQKLYNTPKFSCLSGKHCHCDPNLTNFYNEKEFLGSVGQCEISQSHLANQNIKKNDIFIFWGLFREAKIDKNQLDIAKKQQHIMYGYLQIGDIIETYKLNDDKRKSYEQQYPFLINQPHWNKDKYKDIKNNTIYIARETCSFDKHIAGYGMFEVNQKLTLTAPDSNIPSLWELPKAWEKQKLTYHNESCYQNEYLRARSRGQEFIFEEKTQISEYAIYLIEQFSKNRI